MSALEQLLELPGSRPVQYVLEGARTLGDVYENRVRATPDALAHMHKEGGTWHRTSWAELYQRTLSAAGGMVALGIEPGESIAILGPTLPPWAEFDLGGQLAAVVTVGIYPKQSAEQVRYLLDHSQSRAIFVADEDELRTVLEAVKDNTHLQAIVTWTDELAASFKDADERILPPSRFFTAPLEEAAARERRASVDPGTPAMLIYTSGTTGPPKGAMISHDNVLAMMGSQDDIMRFYEDDLGLSFLPMAHATERNLVFYARLNTGMAVAYASSIGQVIEELQEVRPTIFGSVPRIFEKVYDRVQGEIARKPAPVRALFHWAVGVGQQRAERLLANQSVPWGLALRFRLAERLVLHKVQGAFGGRVRICVTGAAPVSMDILRFFWACGLPILEAYGMTEATVVTNVNRIDGVRLGTVGRPIPPLEQRLADDGEILIKGPFVFLGYLNNEQATQETVVDGWLHTGDIGTIDEEGFLRITDRKKHLIITAGGKNVAPANIERAIKGQSPFISQVHAHGDRRPYISAVLTPSPLETLDWGARHDVLDSAEAEQLAQRLMADPQSRPPELQAAMAKVAAEPRFRALFLDAVREGNQNLARVERVRRFYLLDRDFSVEAGELTPTLKMKRRTIEERYAEVFDRIYDEEGFAENAEPG